MESPASDQPKPSLTLSEAKVESQLESLRQKATLASLRADISEAFHHRGGLDIVLQACCAALVNNLQAAFARIWILDKAGETLELRASAGLYVHLDGPHGQVKVGDFKIGRIAKNLQPHISNSVITDPEVSNPQWARQEGMVSFAGYPLVIDKKALGVVAFFARHELSPDVLNEFIPIVDGISQWVKRHQAEAELVEQREWLDVTLRSIGDAVIATDDQGRITFMNPIAETLTEWPSSEAIGKPLDQVFAIVNEETQQVVDNPVTKVLRENRIVELANHTVLLGRAGTETAIDDSAAPIRDSQGRVMGVILVFHAVTARRRAERERLEALKAAQTSRAEAEILNRVGRSLASELELHKVVQLAVDASRELSGAGFAALFYNATDEEHDNFSHCAVSGVTDDRLREWGMVRTAPYMEATFKGSGILRVGNMITEGYLTPSSGGPAHAPFHSFLASSIISRSGAILGGLFLGHAEPNRFSETSSRLIEGVSGQIASALDNAQLYTALSKAKEKLARQAEDLEQKIIERTAKLQETVSSLEGVSYSIAHDLRGPLRSMEAFSTALLEDCPLDLNARAHDYAKRISAAAKRMDVLISELLTYGRLAHQEIPVSIIQCDEIVAQVLQSLESLIQETRSTISVGPLGPVLGNASVLEQVLVNLLTNAMKFTRAGVPPKIEISAEHGEKHTLLQVRDHGIGIAPHHRSRIFKIFERLHPKDYPGTGIGLAVVQKSVERMRGTIGVSSTLGVGSRFWIELPNGK